MAFDYLHWLPRHYFLRINQAGTREPSQAIHKTPSASLVDAVAVRRSVGRSRAEDSTTDLTERRPLETPRERQLSYSLIVVTGRTATTNAHVQQAHSVCQFFT